MKTPTHRCEMHFPNGNVKVFEAFPTEKLRIKKYCKYCYTTHRNWWQMKTEDYGRADIVLCGECEYTSIKDDA